MMRERLDRTIAELEPVIDRARQFSGWSFGDVRVKHLDGPLPWDYEAIAHQHASRAASIVDLGTGGGEVLSRVIAGLDARVIASEEWHINAPVAAARLRPQGVGVIRADSLRLPFRDAAFDLVLDRHEALQPSEIARVLGAGGRIVTQQCGPDDWPEVGRFLDKVPFPDHFSIYQRGLREAGLVVEETRWHERRVAFESLGDLVYMLLLMPWSVPGFDPVRDVQTLVALEDGLRTDDGIVLTEMRYLIVAAKPR